MKQNAQWMSRLTRGTDRAAGHMGAQGADTETAGTASAPKQALTMSPVLLPMEQDQR